MRTTDRAATFVMDPKEVEGDIPVSSLLTKEEMAKTKPGDQVFLARDNPYSSVLILTMVPIDSSVNPDWYLDYNFGDITEYDYTYGGYDYDKENPPTRGRFFNIYRAKFGTLRVPA